MLTRIFHHFSSHRRTLWIVFTVSALLVIVALVGVVTVGLIRLFFLIVSTFLILFFPGLSLTFIAFPFSDRIIDETDLDTRQTLDIIERLTLAVALSIVISSILVYLLSIIPSRDVLNQKNLAFTIIFVNIALVAGAAWRKRWWILFTR